MENRILDEITGKCECNIGYKEDKTGLCRICYLYKGRCFYKCPENTKINKELKICDH